MKLESKRKQDKIGAQDLRTLCVSVRLNVDEMKKLDSVRACKKRKYKRGEALRMLALTNLPPVVPEVNQKAWSNAGRAVGNFNQLMAKMNSNATVGNREILAAVEEVKREIIEVRKLLISEVSK